MNATITSTENQFGGKEPIALDFVEGQEVVLLAGARVNGLITRCNQPAKVVHVQHSAEFGTTYVVAFGKLGMVAYASAAGLEAVQPVEETSVPATVAFMTEPVCGVVGRTQASGVVLTSKFVRNTRYLLVASDVWKSARWLSINRVEFVKTAVE